MAIRVEVILEGSDLTEKELLEDIREMFAAYDYTTLVVFANGMCPVVGPHKAVCGRGAKHPPNEHMGGCNKHEHHWDDEGKEVQ